MQDQTCLEPNFIDSDTYKWRKWFDTWKIFLKSYGVKLFSFLHSQVNELSELGTMENIFTEMYTIIVP